MNARMRFLGVALIVLTLPIGCSTAHRMMGGGTSQEVVAESLERMPPDAARVLRAIGSRLGGYPATSEVRLSPPVEQILRNCNAVEAGFRVHAANLTRFTPEGGTPPTHLAEGRMELRDDLGRRTALTFATSYSAGSDGLIVHSVHIRPLFDAPPAAVCFVAPAKSVGLADAAYPDTYTAFYRYIGERALAPESVVPGAPQEYVIAVFFLNRMSPSAKECVSISSSPSGIQGYDKESRYLDFNGWRVGLGAGRLALKSPQSESSIYAKAIYTPGTEAGLFRMADLVGVYALAQK